MADEHSIYQWNHPKTSDYNETIRRRIIGYELLFDLMAHILITSREKNASRFLIVGAGGGQELSTLIHYFREASFVALDPSEQMLDVAKQRLIEEQIDDACVRYVQGYITDEKEMNFDVVSCHLVLHFIENFHERAEFVQQLSSKLKTGGLLFLSSVRGDITTTIFQEELNAWEKTMKKNGITDRQWEKFRASIGNTLFPTTEEQLDRLFLRANLRVKHVYYKALVIVGYCLEKV